MEAFKYASTVIPEYGPHHAQFREKAVELSSYRGDREVGEYCSLGPSISVTTERSNLHDEISAARQPDMIPTSDRSQPVTGGHKRSQVEVLHAYANPSLQLDAVLDRFQNALGAGEMSSGPSWRLRDDGELSVMDTPQVSPRSLHRRLSAEQCVEIVRAFNHGTPQKKLAAMYGISVRSVRRLVRAAREQTRQGHG
jgi:hypothetical protein